MIDIRTPLLSQATKTPHPFAPYRISLTISSITPDSLGLLSPHSLYPTTMYTRYPQQPKQLQSKSAGPNTRCQVRFGSLGRLCLVGSPSRVKAEWSEHADNPSRNVSSSVITRTNAPTQDRTRPVHRALSNWKRASWVVISPVSRSPKSSRRMQGSGWPTRSCRPRRTRGRDYRRSRIRKPARARASRRAGNETRAVAIAIPTPTLTSGRSAARARARVHRDADDATPRRPLRPGPTTIDPLRLLVDDAAVHQTPAPLHPAVAIARLVMSKRRDAGHEAQSGDPQEALEAQLSESEMSENSTLAGPSWTYSTVSKVTIVAHMRICVLVYMRTYIIHLIYMYAKAICKHLTSP